MNLRDLPRFLRTVRYLRISQMAWRLRRLIRERRPVPPPPPVPFKGPEDALRPGPFPFVPFPPVPASRRGTTVSALGKGRFTHLNRTRDLGRDGTDWRLGPCHSARLWTQTLHYHAWAHDAAQSAAEGSREGAELFRHYVSDWIVRCPPTIEGTREMAWNPYAIATRIGWWIRSYLLIDEDDWDRWAGFRRMFLESLWQQARYLHRHLEWDLRGNHLLRDALGLAWAGRFFRGEEADRWWETAAEIAVDQVAEQVLPDGGHFERSPMYHIQVMEDILTLVPLLKERPARMALREAWRKMAGYIAWVRHPDGEIPLFNDSARAAVSEPGAIIGLGEQIDVSVDTDLPTGGRHFEETGLVAWHGKPWSVLFDVGPVGPDHQPGHAHADTFTLECSYEGQKLIVDPGTYGYDRDDLRRYDRSTDAHNTVCIDDGDSSEVWDIFRVGRRAVPTKVRSDITERAALATGTHGGYDSLLGGVRHERFVRALAEGKLTIRDTIHGSGRHKIRGGFLLAPAWSGRPNESGWDISSGARRLRVEVASPPRTSLSVEQREYHPEFGRSEQVKRLSWSITAEPPVEVEVTLGAAE